LSLDLTFKSSDVEVVAPRIEQIVREDLGLSDPVVYTLSDVVAPQSRSRGLLAFAKAATTGSKVSPLMTLALELPGPRKGLLRANVGQLQRASFMGALSFVIPIGKPLSGEVSLGKRGLLAVPEFMGGPEAEILNKVPGLAKRVDGALVAKAAIGMTIQITPEFRLFTTPEGSLLLVRTLPVITAIRLTTVRGTTNAREILAIADAIEAAL
jgi:hypothetical protein